MTHSEMIQETEIMIQELSNNNGQPLNDRQRQELADLQALFEGQMQEGSSQRVS